MKLKDEIITEIINLSVSIDVNSGEIDFSLRINPNYSPEDIKKYITKEICKRSELSKALRLQSDALIDIRSLIDK